MDMLKGREKFGRWESRDFHKAAHPRWWRPAQGGASQWGMSANRVGVAQAMIDRNIARGSLSRRATIQRA